MDDSGAWTRDEEREALNDLPRLTALAHSGTALLRPLLRREIETAVTALIRRNRWEDVVRLTEGMTDVIDRVPSDLVWIRAEALRRTNRIAPARDLLSRVSSSDQFIQRSSPASLFSLARVFASLEDYEHGIQFAEKASSRLRLAVGRMLIRRLKMEQKLVASSVTFSSEHFLIRCPPSHPESGARKLAAVLEGERKRLSRWIPIQSRGNVDKIEVQLLWFRDFEVVAEGAEVIGLFDGKIRLPFAGGERLDFSHPEIVSIVSHELAHAMISELTSDSAPHWLQEGLAQHVAMEREHFNPVPSLERSSRFLSLPVVDGVLAGLPDSSLAQVSYEEALWMLHFVEATSGVEGIHRMLAAFRDGATTEEALHKASFTSVADFETRFRQWSRLPASSSWRGPILRYLGDTASDDARLPDSLTKSSRRVNRWEESAAKNLFVPLPTPTPKPDPRRPRTG